MIQLIDVLAAGVTSSSGTVLASGTVTSYEAGTTTLQTLYQDFELTTPHSNPLTLDAAGRAVAYANGRVKLVIANSSGTVVRTIDDIGVEDSDVLSDIQSDLTEQIESAVEGVDEISSTTITASSYTVLSTDELILANAASNAITVNLPAAASNTGRRLWVKKTDTSTNAVTLDGNSSETIDGATTQSIALQNACIGITSDGSNWKIISLTSAVVLDSTAFTAKNYILNGAFDRFERTHSTSNVSSNLYVADRFKWEVDNMDQLRVTASRSTDVPTLTQSGFYSTYSLKIDVTTAEDAIDVDDRCIISHRLQGYDWAEIKGKTVTLQFWAQSTKTGIHCVSFRNNGNDRSYVAEYTVPDTNWNQYSVTLALNPSGGTDDFVNGVGLIISWCLHAGATYQTTAGAWQTGNYVATSNQVSSVDNAANNFNLAQVALFVSSAALAFRRCGSSIEDEHRMCEAYYQKSYSKKVEPATSTATGQIAVTQNGTGMTIPLRFPVPMRGAPTVTLYNPSTGGTTTWRDTSGAANITVAASNIGETGCTVTVTAGTDGNALTGHYTADADF